MCDRRANDAAQFALREMENKNAEQTRPRRADYLEGWDDGFAAAAEYANHQAAREAERVQAMQRKHAVR